jgi:diguanylate cyclase (GGDEF)-like protein
MNNLPLARLLTLAALAAVYFAAAKFGLGFAFVNASATAIWAPTGIALAALLVLGYDAWPAILVGAFVANLTTQGSLATSIGIGIGNTLEALIGAYLVNRFANGRLFYARTRDIFVFAALAAIISTGISASVGVATLTLGGFARLEDFGPIWSTWWLGDAAGDLIVAPMLILWSTSGPVQWQGRWTLEAGALSCVLAGVALVVFGGLVPAVRSEHLPLAFLCTPLLFWAAFRLGRRAVTTCMFLLSWIAIWGTLHGLGEFVRASQNESLLLLQTYLAVQAVTMLAVAGVVWERRQGELQLRRQAVIDPLTGLANYRQMISVLVGEIKRSERANRSFAVLLLDLDGLKVINDRHGHLVGNRALCRVADSLRASGRAADTAARFGGDEFACVLPETSEVGARQLASRLARRLQVDPEQPQLSVSMGLAVYPRDGATAELLLSAADRGLYEAKTIRGARSTVQLGQQVISAVT